MKKALSMTMAALMAVSTGITVFAESTENSELESTLAMVKQRVSVPSELSEFSYSTTKQGPVTIYEFMWQTPDDAEEYKCISVSAYNSLIMSYHNYDSSYYKYNSEGCLAKCGADELYSKAKQAVKKLNPSLSKNIKIDKDSLSMSLYSENATFTVYRTKNGIPVNNDTGRITLNKNTGELMSFNINWHPKASFKSADGVLTQDEAWEKYSELIDIEPQYEIVYDYSKGGYSSRLVYVQSNYGEINAYTGERSNFQADAFYSNDEMYDEDFAGGSADVEGANGSSLFTKQELEELSKELPYGNEQAVINLVKENKYLTYFDNMSLEYDYLYKQTDEKEPRYIYTAEFSNSSKDDYFEDDFYYEEPIYDDEIDVLAAEAIDSYVSMSITLDAQTGEILNYNYYDSARSPADSYNLEKADKKAAKVFKALAPTHTKDYTNYNSGVDVYSVDQKEKYSGSYHSYGRVANGIKVDGESVFMMFGSDMTLTYYNVAYHDVEFADTDGMLTAEQVMAKHRENNTLDLCYLAKTGKKKTGTVLVYKCDAVVYADAFTGEPVYSQTKEKNDFSGITDAQLLKKAKILDYNGLVIMSGGKKQSDAITQGEFTSLIGCITSSSLYRLRGNLVLPSGAVYSYDDQLLTRADAMVLYASAACGTKITELQGIFKNPFSDVDDADKFLGCYAAAYALGATDGAALNGGAAYTYADIIKLLYDNLA